MSSIPSTPLLEVSGSEGHIVARLAGYQALHESNAELVGGQLTVLAQARPGQHFILDLQTINYLTSTALGKLVALNRLVRAGGGRLSVANVQPAVWEVFAVTR